MLDDSSWFIYDPVTEIVLPYNPQMLIGWVDTKKHKTTEERIQEMRVSAPLLENVINGIEKGYPIEIPKDDHKGTNAPMEDHAPLYRLVWVCYVKDSYDNPVVVNVVSSMREAEKWVEETPAVIGESDGRQRFCEMYRVLGE